MANYEWANGSLADAILVEVLDEESTTGRYKPQVFGYVMKSSPTAYVAWLPKDNHTGNRMEFYDMETAKAWVFTQVRMNDGSALIRTDSLR